MRAKGYERVARRWAVRPRVTDDVNRKRLIVNQPFVISVNARLCVRYEPVIERFGCIVEFYFPALPAQCFNKEIVFTALLIATLACVQVMRGGVFNRDKRDLTFVRHRKTA